VIRLDYGGGSYASGEELVLSLTYFLEDIAKNYGLSLADASLSVKFNDLIKQLHTATGRQVVILIDEYDNPIIDNISNPDVLEGNKRILHDFYKVMKARDEDIRFIFLTGVARFSGLSIFSGLNNLNDITIDDEYAAICGCTQSELEEYFSERLDEISLRTGMSKPALLDKIRYWYNGYSWDGTTAVYNPFSTLQFFDKMQFQNFWFRTGTPTFLIETIKKRNGLKPVLEPVTVDSAFFEGFDYTVISETQLLFQTGYLTVKDRKIIDLIPQYTLDIPNNEVRKALFDYLLTAYSNYPLEQTYDLRRRMHEQLLQCNTAALEQSLREMLAYVPFALHLEYEAYYHSLMLLWLKMLGFDIIGEVNTNIGTIDAVWKFPGHTVVAEVKCRIKKGRMATLLTNAIKQIKQNRYYER
jgi:hypothetical protein